MGKIYICFAILSSSFLLGMDDPEEVKWKVIAQETGNRTSYLSTLPVALVPQISSYVASFPPATHRDNHADYIIEQGQNIARFTAIAQDASTWQTTLDEQSAIDAVVKYAQFHPQEESHFKPNVFSVTAAVPAPIEILKKRFLDRMPQFKDLSAADKNKAVVDAIKVCPCVEVIAPMIAAGASVHAHNPGSLCTLLHYAVRDSEPDLVAFLLDGQASPDSHDRQDSTALHYAVHTRNVPIALLLINKGAQVNLWDADKNNALYYAALNGDEKMVEFLTSKGASIYYYEGEDHLKDTNNIFDRNVLVSAVQHQSLPMLKTLIASRRDNIARLASFEMMLNVALIVAAKKGLSKIIKFFLSLYDEVKFEPNEIRPKIQPDWVIADHSAISHALINGHFGVAYELLKYSTDNYASNAPHCCASRSSSLAIATEKLCALGTDNPRFEIIAWQLEALIDLFLDEDTSPIKAYRPSACLRAAQNGNTQLVNRFLTYAIEGGDIRAPYKVMREAAAIGSAPAVRTLLQFPVSPTMVDLQGDTPLHKAVAVLDGDNLSLIEDLVQLGADVAAKNGKR